MHISLSPELERRIQEKLDSGPYSSASALIAEALELLEERERDYQFDVGQIRVAIERSINEIDHGLGIDGPAFFRELMKRGKAESS